MGGRELDDLMQTLTPRVPALTLYARQWIDSASADDVVQEALTRLFCQRSPPDDPLAWMFRTVRNAAIDSGRASSRRRRRERAVAEARQEWFEPGVDALIDARTAEQALASLAVENRQIVILRLWGDLAWAQIAELMDVGLSTVHDRYGRALKQMREALEKPCSKTNR
jgi:RNA polymerase sigma-70 factor (ECF subfamily)